MAQATDKPVTYEIGPRRPGDVAAVWANPEKAEEVLGWRAELGIREMCEDTWRWQESNPLGYREEELVETNNWWLLVFGMMWCDRIGYAKIESNWKYIWINLFTSNSLIDGMSFISIFSVIYLCLFFLIVVVWIHFLVSYSIQYEEWSVHSTSWFVDSIV